MQLVLIGPPGGGKGTQAKFLIEHFSIPQISTGDILRKNVRNKTTLGEKAQKYMHSGELVPDSLILQMMEKRLIQNDCTNGYILDGFPRTIPQEQGLKKILEHLNQQIDNVLVMDVPDELIITRLSNRRSCAGCDQIYNLLFDPPADRSKCDQCKSELFLREDDRPSIIEQRLEVYHKSTAPLIQYYNKQGNVLTIDSKGTIDEIRLEILKQLKT